MTKEKLYYTALTVTVRPEGIPHAEAQAQHALTGDGFCDGLFVASIAYRSGAGNHSVMFYDFHGADDNGLNAAVVFYVWARMTERILQRGGIDDMRLTICQTVWDKIGPAIDVTHDVVTDETRSYQISYNLKPRPEGFCVHEAVHEAEAKKLFASDAMIIAALDHYTIPYDLVFSQCDGRTGTEIPDQMWWDVWAFLGRHLLDNYELPPSITGMLEAMFYVIVQLITREQSNSRTN